MSATAFRISAKPERLRSKSTVERREFTGNRPRGRRRAVSYTAADITELDDVQHTRLRPAVNLGLDVLNTALRELVDNAIEEVADPDHGGSTVTITLHADGSVSVADDGRGLPVDTDSVNGKNGIVKTLGTARAGGKFSAHVDATSTGAGLNGIGAAAAIFISARADVTVRRAGKPTCSASAAATQERSTARTSTRMPSSPEPTPRSCAA